MSEASSRASERIPAIDAIQAAAIVAVAMMRAGPGSFALGPDRVLRWLSVAWTPFHVRPFSIVAGFLDYRAIPIGA